jgi:radical SAM superfamily enzyme YgiQ (UPF0313 family)
LKPYDAARLRALLQSRERMIPDLCRKVESFRPDLIAVSATEDTYPLGLELLEGLRRYPIPNLMGGVFATFAPEKVIREPAVDMLCVGEGEGPLLDLCAALTAGADYTRIPNLWVKDAHGTVVKNPLREPVDLDTLPPPDFSVMDEARFYFPSRGRLLRMGSVETARGCPYKCSFCNSPAQVSLYKEANGKQFFRLKSVENVYRELCVLRDRWQVEYVLFPADTFLAMPDYHFEEFAAMYQEIRLPFWCQTRPETVTAAKARTLERMGCVALAVGIEHGNERFRREVVQRSYTNDLLVECMNNLKGTSIHVTVNNIVGLPTETRELTWDSIRLNRRIQHVVHTQNVFHFVPYHGTPLRRLAVQKGYIADDTKVEPNTRDTVLDMPQYRRDAIRGVMRTFTMYTRFPESYFPRIGHAENLDADGERAFAELREEFIARYFPLKNDGHNQPLSGTTAPPPEPLAHTAAV